MAGNYTFTSKEDAVKTGNSCCKETGYRKISFPVVRRNNGVGHYPTSSAYYITLRVTLYNSEEIVSVAVAYRNDFFPILISFREIVSMC